MDNFNQSLDKYAELAARVGVNIQPGQRLFVRGSRQAPEFVHRAARAAYRAGASLVHVIWEDDAMDLIRVQESAPENLSIKTDWYAHAFDQAAARGDAMLFVHSADPGLYAGVDADRVSVLRKTWLESISGMSAAQGRSEIQWSVCRAPTPQWAKRVLPDNPAAEAELWNMIFGMCRVTDDDPIVAWREHIADLGKRREALTAKRYRALHFKSPETDLELGLPTGHIWQGGGQVSTKGVPYAPNIPTQEVFTLPHRDQAEGHVTMTRPLSLSGVLIDKFTLTFERGRVVKFTASNAADVLEKKLMTDEGAARLGEVALVAASNPIARHNLIFYDILYDENAASHIALGRAFPFTLNDGDKLSAEELRAAGANHSLIHEDTMIGSPAMDVDGVREDGTREPVMRAGEWAFEV